VASLILALRDLAARLLDPVLAERGHAGRDGLADALDLDGLRDGDEQHVLGAPARAPGRAGDPLPYPLEVRPDVVHAGF
jgi:hypothetical protein